MSSQKKFTVAPRKVAPKRKWEKDDCFVDLTDEGARCSKKRNVAVKSNIKSKDSNIQRSLPQKVICNNQLVNNKFRSKVKATDVEFVCSYFSHYAMGPKGMLKSDLISNLVSVIREYGKNRTVLGCVAWLSSPDVLEALNTCRRVLLIVNREDYNCWGGGKMLEKYQKLPKFDEPLSVAFGHLESVLATLENGRSSGRSQYSSVRAFGNPSTHAGATGAARSQGLEHCKYLIFFDSQCHKRCPDSAGNNQNSIGYPSALKERACDYVYKDVPCAVWTGSMNFTKASETHHENAVFIKSRNTAMAYLHDFSESFMASVPVGSKSNSQTPKSQLEKKGQYRSYQDVA